MADSAVNGKRNFQAVIEENQSRHSIRLNEPPWSVKYA
jgi:hypothetical protein